jgi:hypothetical protein
MRVVVPPDTWWCGVVWCGVVQRVVRAFHGGVNYSLVSVPGRPHLLSTFIRNACLVCEVLLFSAMKMKADQ